VADSPGSVLQAGLRRPLVLVLARVRTGLDQVGALAPLRPAPEAVGTVLEGRLLEPLGAQPPSDPVAAAALGGLRQFVTGAGGLDGVTTALHGWDGGPAGLGFAYVCRTGGLTAAVSVTGDGGTARLTLVLAGAADGGRATLAEGWTMTVSGRAGGTLEAALGPDGPVQLSGATATDFAVVDFARIVGRLSDGSPRARRPKAGAGTTRVGRGHYWEAVVDPCFTPGAITPSPILRSAMGEIAEIIIKRHYCREKGGCKEFLKLPGGPQTDFFDVTMGFHRCRHLAAYLKLHNPHVDEVAIAADCESKKLGIFKFPIPDIITHEPPGRVEFYEIKPNSDNGKNDADAKIDWFLALSHVFNLPYKAGELFTPDERLLVWDGTWYGVPAKVHFHYFRDKKGRLLYELCIEASLDTLAEMLWKQLVKAVLLALIVIIIRRPRPTPSPPPELPAPVPVPIPIPVPRIPVPAFLSPVESSTSPLGQSVGTGGVNEVQDVAYAQLLLGHWLAGRTSEAPIAVDGDAGPATIGAIHAFQEAVTGVVDDRLDPGGPAIQALERDHWSACLEAVALDFDAPLEGEFTTEENEGGPHLGFELETAVAEGAQDFLHATFSVAQEMRA
jgi:hypothetical protein